MNKALLLVVILVLALGAWLALTPPFFEPFLNDNEPEQVDDRNGQKEDENDPFLQAIEEKSNLIRVTSPEPYERIGSPLLVTGVARGTWYFEASFPVALLDEAGEVIASGIATAQGEWMTEDFVPFTATLTWTDAVLEPAFLILSKDNPSGLSEYDDALRIPVQ